MTPVQACSICNSAIVGFDKDAQPINDGRCCDRCHAERVIPERARRILERDASSNARAGRCNDLRYTADDAKRQSGGGMTGIQTRPSFPAPRPSREPRFGYPPMCSRPVRGSYAFLPMETTRVHHAARRRGRVAACRARAADRSTGDTPPSLDSERFRSAPRT